MPGDHPQDVEVGDVEVGHWFTDDAVYSSDPSATNEVQDAPGPLATYDLTAG